MWTYVFTKIALFSQRCNKIYIRAQLVLVILKLPAGVADTIFFHTSPAKRLESEWLHFFSQREDDSEGVLLDVNFSNLHTAFGAMISMVRRTI